MKGEGRSMRHRYSANRGVRLTLDLSLLLFLGFGAFGCSQLTVGQYHGPVGSYVGPQPLLRYDPAPFLSANPERILVGLACSGGGSRASYLTAAILREIHRSQIRIDLDDQSKGNTDILSQIDFVSAVSGGGLSAAYFVANFNQLQGDADSQAWEEYLNKMAANYRQRQWYWLGIANPISWLKTLFTTYNRGDIARDDYDKILYEGKTIADLPERPVLYLNAFDVGNHVRFVFSRHFIDTGFYHDKTWLNALGEPQDLTYENDLVFARIDPKSIRLADAVYASSAFPFIYPNVALNHFGNKIAYQGNLLFLADGGLADNSGLLTLFTQMNIEFGISKKSRLVLAIYIDASVDSFREGTIFQRQGKEADYAWHNTYLGHGRTGVESALTNHEDAVFRFLDEAGVLVDDIPNYETKLVRMPSPQDSGKRASWFGELRSGRLMLRPAAIGLRIRDIGDAYYNIWSRYKDGDGPEFDRLLKLFEASGIPSGLGQDHSEWPATTFQELERRLSGIETDFVLGEDGRKVLDLAAYLLVHGKLEVALKRWNEIASSRFRE